MTLPFKVASTFVSAILVATALLNAQPGLTANAGPDQSDAFVAEAVTLDGSASLGATTFLWEFTQRPTGSTASVVNPTTVAPSFVPDRAGIYTVRLTVGNGS